MRTKLVYVLTSSPEGNYIEQALLAIYSARYWNPNAYIILITDNLTDQLFVGKRSDILTYLSEKIVIPFEDNQTMMYRSRWIKTSVRNLVDGDYLFIDSDTITTRCLNNVDTLTCQVGAVPDSHLLVKEFGKELLAASKEKVSPIGIDIEKEDVYFSSGVLLVKDTPLAYSLYKRWHSIWLQGVQQGFCIDQPALAKANIEAGHLIERIADGYNCVIYTQPDFANEASILHFTAYRNPSWLFSKRVLRIIRDEGIKEWMIPFILNPVSTYIPFRYSISRMSISSLFQSIRSLSKSAKAYCQNVDDSFTDMNPSSIWHRIAKVLYKKRLFIVGSTFCLLPAWISIKIKNSTPPVPNICAQ